MKPSTCRYFSVVHVTFFYVFQVIVPLSTRTGYYSVSPICICAERNVSAKFKAHLHNDLVSADTLTLSDDPVHFTNAPKKSRGNTTLPMVVMEN